MPRAHFLPAPRASLAGVAGADDDEAEDDEAADGVACAHSAGGFGIWQGREASRVKEDGREVGSSGKKRLGVVRCGEALTFCALA